MGVRHKDLLVEGVQFHPESILSAEGRSMLKTFLRMQGGTWKENEQLQQRSDLHTTTNGVSGNATNGTRLANGSTSSQAEPQAKESILEQIFAHRRKAVEEQKKVPSQRPSDLQASYDLSLSPPHIAFPDRLRDSGYTLSLMAEVKRASPSKGDIAPLICAPAQARKYAIAGASVISVLTEPKWFKGSIDDLRAVRQSLEGMPKRPAVLRKEFIFDEYQILEARLAGADTVLLIVKMLSEELLRRLYSYSQSLGMEPLVEVNTIEEMRIALQLGAQVIGVNNRNLTNFEVDLDTTSRLMEGVPNETIVCALSGITGPEDVEAYQKNGVSAVLVGEALMRAENTKTFVNRLLGGSDNAVTTPSSHPLMVKICGTRTSEAAKAAIEAGADMIGIILVQGRTRCISNDTALQISTAVHETRKPSKPIQARTKSEQAFEEGGYFDHEANCLRRQDRALLVGVFRNQPLSYILSQLRLLNLDIVQLHGSEPIEWARLIPVPVIRRFGPGDAGLGTRGYHALPLLDSALGGSGQTLELDESKTALTSDDSLRVVLAGGLTPENAEKILTALEDFSPQIVAVDVSSGVERDGKQDHERIKNFITAAKQAPRG